MMTFLMVLHIMVCLTLILVVLLQRGKGSDIGAALGGGGSNTVFGSRGAGNFLTKLTSGAAIVFMMTSLSLSYLGTQDAKITVFDDEVEGVLPSDTLEEVEQGSDAAPTDVLEEVEPEATSDELQEVVPLDMPAEPTAEADDSKTP